MFGMFGLGGQEIALLIVPGILLFDRKLPEVGRSPGRMITEFRHGLREVEQEAEMIPTSGSRPPSEPVSTPKRIMPCFDDGSTGNGS
jgi:sec-independent protein translocase protein TatA